MDGDGDVLFLRNGSGSNHDDVWDDTALIQAYDKAVNVAKEAVAKRIAMATCNRKKEQSTKKEDSKEGIVTGTDNTELTGTDNNDCDASMQSATSEQHRKQSKNRKKKRNRKISNDFEMRSHGFPGFPQIPVMGNNLDFPIPPPIPFPLGNQSNSRDDLEQQQSLSAMLISWYMTGYYTGYYQGTRSTKKTKR